MGISWHPFLPDPVKMICVSTYPMVEHLSLSLFFVELSSIRI